MPWYGQFKDRILTQRSLLQQTKALSFNELMSDEMEKQAKVKSYFLSHVLCIETIFFGRNRNAFNRTKESPPMHLLSDKQYDE